MGLTTADCILGSLSLRAGFERDAFIQRLAAAAQVDDDRNIRPNKLTRPIRPAHPHRQRRTLGPGRRRPMKTWTRSTPARERLLRLCVHRRPLSGRLQRARVSDRRAQRRSGGRMYTACAASAVGAFTAAGASKASAWRLERATGGGGGSESVRPCRQGACCSWGGPLVECLSASVGAGRRRSCRCRLIHRTPRRLGGGSACS